jgi:hypothetical protein
MKSIFSVIVIFVGICLVLYISLSMFAAVPLPSNDTEEYETHQSLTNIVNISFQGIWGVLLMVILLMIVLIVYSLKSG